MTRSTTITITNTGEVPVSITDLTDSRTEQTFYTDAAATVALGTLPTLNPAGDPGDSITLYYRSEILESDAIKGNIDNEVTVNGTATVAGNDVAVTDTANSGPCPFVPDTGIEVVKSCPTGEDLAVGDKVVYTLTITNDGEIPATITSIGESRAETTFYTDDTLATEQTFPFVVPTGDNPVTLYYQSEITPDDAINGQHRQHRDGALVDEGRRRDDAAGVGGSDGHSVPSCRRRASRLPSTARTPPGSASATTSSTASTSRTPARCR